MRTDRENHVRIVRDHGHAATCVGEERLHAAPHNHACSFVNFASPVPPLSGLQLLCTDARSFTSKLPLAKGATGHKAPVSRRPLVTGNRRPTDRGRERLSPSPPSEPGVQFSRDGLSSQLFPHRDWRANRWASDIVKSPRSAKKAFGHCL